MRQYLIDGFRFGFSIDYVGPRINFSSKNLVSAIANPSAVDEKLANEIKLGRIVGPFERQPFPVFHISPLGLIPKKVPGEFRLIIIYLSQRGVQSIHIFQKLHPVFIMLILTMRLD